MAAAFDAAFEAAALLLLTTLVGLLLLLLAVSADDIVVGDVVDWMMVLLTEAVAAWNVSSICLMTPARQS